MTTLCWVPHQGKSLDTCVNDVTYLRLPLRTHVITKDDRLVEVVQRYAAPHIRPEYMIFVSERIVAITQGRAFPITEIQPSALATFLSRFVHKSSAGIGIGSPWTMELAIREAGIFVILLASLAAALTKPFGIRGLFYRIAGRNVRAIDGPCPYTLPPYHEYAILGPLHPNRVAHEIKQVLGCEVVIIDANDLGVEVLGRSSADISPHFCRQVFRDNPLGQSTEQTPLCIVRRA